MMRKFMLLLMVLSCLTRSWAQPVTVSGRITDAKDGATLSGVSVSTKDGKVGVQSKTDGTYTITVPSAQPVLVFSFIGYQTLERSTRGGTLNVSLSANEAALNEVVVIGYGTQRRKEVTGNVATVSGKAVADKPIQTFEQALGGRAAGVQITVANGVLNSPPVFRIRGTNSISLSSYPLIVVDGVPSFTGDVSTTNAAGNALGSINPNDIESIDIAKDAAATAIYGSRAANGVVFVTTKRGRAGKPRVSYNGWVSRNDPFRLPELLNAAEYIGFKTTAVANNPTAAAWKFNLANDANGNPINTNWSDYVYRSAYSHSHNVNVSGGNDASNYYFSAGYTDQEGILQKNDLERVNVLFNIDNKIGKYVSLGGKVAIANEKNLSAGNSGSLSGSAFSTGGMGRLAFVLPPIISPYNNDGSYNLNGSAIGSSNITGTSSLSYYNPVPILDLNKGTSENNRIQSNAYFQVKPLAGLTLRTTYGIDYLLVDNETFWSPVAGDGFSYGGYATSGADKYKTTLWTTTGQYDRTIAADHTVSLLAGTEQQRRTSSGYGLNRQTLSDPAYTVIQAGFTTNNPANLYIGENYLLSYFGRLNYNYAGKYFLSGNLRQDEYSALGVKKGTFWGASASWEIAKENFWASAGLDRTFTSFRLRGSYGKVGNVSGIGDYSPYSTFGSGLYGGTPTLAFSSVGNDKLQWETSKKLDVGIAFGMFHDRITSEITYYKNNIDGLILAVQQAPSTGLPNSPNENVGSMYNEGIEFSLNTTPVQKKDFSWSSNFNVTYNKNEVTSLAPGLPFITASTSSLETVSRTQPGYSIGQLWVVRTAGVDPDNGKRIFVNAAGQRVYYQFYVPTGTPTQYNYSTTPDGTTRYVNATGGTAITQANDAVLYANTQPKIYGGWDNTFRYKNFDLNVMVTYQADFYVYYGSNAGLHDQRWWNNASDVLTDAWMSRGQTGKLYAKPVFNDNVSNGSAFPLDINVFKGDFIKFRNLTLGYTLPKTITDKVKIGSFRLYAMAQNLGIITAYPGPDPEVSSNGNSTTSQGVDRNTAANARTFVVGLNVGF